MTVFQKPSVVGLTQASRVMRLVRSSFAASGTVTSLLVPLKESAPPNLPLPDHVAPFTVPVLAFPELSAATVPEPALKEYEATGGAGCDVDEVGVAMSLWISDEESGSS